MIIPLPREQLPPCRSAATYRSRLLYRHHASAMRGVRLSRVGRPRKVRHRVTAYFATRWASKLEPVCYSLRVLFWSDVLDAHLRSRSLPPVGRPLLRRSRPWIERGSFATTGRPTNPLTPDHHRVTFDMEVGC